MNLETLFASVDTTNKIGVGISLLGSATAILGEIDSLIKIFAGLVAICAGSYTIYYTFLKIRQLREKKDQTEE